MKKPLKPIFAATALAFAVSFTAPAGAQGISIDAVVQACEAQPESCAALIENFIATSGLSGNALVGQLSELAQRLTDVVATLGRVQGIDLDGILVAIVRVVEVVREVDPAVADQILVVAEQVAEQIGETLPNEASPQ